MTNSASSLGLQAGEDVKVFHVFNMQTERTCGWVVRAMKAGLKVTSRSGRFGDEINFVKDAQGNFLQVIQNTQASRRLEGGAMSAAQLAIVGILQVSGLVAPLKSFPYLFALASYQCF